MLLTKTRKKRVCADRPTCPTRPFLFPSRLIPGHILRPALDPAFWRLEDFASLVSWKFLAYSRILSCCSVVSNALLTVSCVIPVEYFSFPQFFLMSMWTGTLRLGLPSAVDSVRKCFLYPNSRKEFWEWEEHVCVLCLTMISFICILSLFFSWYY